MNFPIFLHIMLIILVSIIFFCLLFGGHTLVNMRKKYPGLSISNTIVYEYILLGIIIILLTLGIIFSGDKNKQDNVGSTVFVLDVSKSMMVYDTPDSSQNRLDLAKSAILEYIKNNPLQKYGLIIFSGEAISSVPLTSNFDFFSTTLTGVDYRNLTKQGTNFSKAIALANLRFLDDEPGRIILFSDGGDDGDVIASKGLIKKKNINYSIYGVGSKEGGKIILGRGPFGDTIYQTYQGQDVVTKRNDQNLKKLAKNLGANYDVLTKKDTIGSINSTASFEGIRNNDVSLQILFSAFISFLIYVLLLILRKPLGK